jgi:hypothetical protein
MQRELHFATTRLSKQAVVLVECTVNGHALIRLVQRNGCNGT